MKRISFLSIIVILLMISVGSKTNGADKVSAMNNNTVQSGNEKAVSIPLPESDANADWECGTYFSNISKEKIQDYLRKLVSDDWKDLKGEKISSKAVVGTHEYILTKDDKLLQMIVYLTDVNNSLGNSILLRVDDKISMKDIKNRKSALSREEAITKIQTIVNEMVNDGKLPSARGMVTTVFEIIIEDAFDQMKLQAYAAIGDNGFTGCFLIRKGVVSYVPGNLKNACIVDIDKDGTYELMDLVTEWSKGIYKCELFAYEYIHPIYFSSLSEVLQKKYYNCFVPVSGYEELQLKKTDNDTVNLIGEAVDYGRVIIDGSVITLEQFEKFPYDLWATSYDQSLLKEYEKELPENPPEINITIDGVSLDYIVQRTNWDKEKSEFSYTKAFDNIMKKEQFIPTIRLDGLEEETARLININFSSSIPDSISLYNAMLNDNGSIRYNDKLISEQTVKMKDRSNVEFKLQQNPAYYLSSNLDDYNRDWYRLFWIVCKWNSKVCTYAFLIKTGSKEILTKIQNHSFLDCDGTYSKLSSTWGMGLTLDRNQLPEHYVVEWQVSDGMIKSWSKKGLKPAGITKQHNGYPMTDSEDENHGEVIWTPLSYDLAEDVKIKVYIYETAEDKTPIAYSEIALENVSGVYRKK